MIGDTAVLTAIEPSTVLPVAIGLLVLLAVLVNHRHRLEEPLEFERHVREDGAEVFRARGPLRHPQLATTNALLLLILLVLAVPAILSLLGLAAVAAGGMAASS